MSATPLPATPAAGPASAEPDPRRRVRKVAVAGGVGTLIEYYDFSVYGYMAVVVAPLFFPSDDPVISLLSALAVFGTAYVVRPIGGVVFGHIGDRRGRKAALIATLVCMGVASTMMGLLPTHAVAGAWATVLLVVVRLLQGFSAGGEVGGAATFISEAAPAGEKARWGSFTPLGSTGGFALAAAVAGTVTWLTTPEQMEAWGWRIPFLLALPLTLVCLWVRAQTEETLESERASESSTAPKSGSTPPAASHAPILGVLRDQPTQVGQSTLISLATNGTAYIGLTYMSIHLIQRMGYSDTSVYWVATAVIAASALLMPLGGRLGDRFGAPKILMAGLLGFVVLTYPMMALMHVGLAVAAVAYLVIMLNTVGAQVGAYTLLPQLFEARYRYTGVALGWNIGVVIAGGTAPFVAVWLVRQTGNDLSPAFFVMFVALLGMIGVSWATRHLVRRTAPRH